MNVVILGTGAVGMTLGQVVRASGARRNALALPPKTPARTSAMPASPEDDGRSPSTMMASGTTASAALPRATG